MNAEAEKNKIIKQLVLLKKSNLSKNSDSDADRRQVERDTIVGFANVKKLVAEIYKNTTEHSGRVFSLSDTSATIRFNIAS